MGKFAVSFRLDNRSEDFAYLVDTIEDGLSKYMLEPVRISVCQHLTTFYYITNSDGTKVARLVACVCDDSALVYAGPI